MRIALVLVALFAVPLDAAKVYLRYDLISQRPDEASAFKPECSEDFKTGGSAFSASSVMSPMHWDGMAKMAWASLEVHMTARTPNDAVRVYRYSWVQTPDGQWVKEGAYTPPIMPAQANAPRTVNTNITQLFNQRATTTVYYVFETRGCPVIYAAYLHGITES